MAILSREQALQANDLTHETVTVPEWGGDVVIWQMPEKRRNDFDHWNAEIVERKDWSQFRARLIADTAGDESGALLFTHDDVPALAEKSSAVVRRLADVALRINRMRAEDREAAEKNSDGDPGADSP